MSILSGKSIIAFALLMTQIVYQIAGSESADATNDGRPSRKQTNNVCPSLVRANNWEIEKV